MSNDKYQQSMQNWKKEIIIDVTLNGLFDSQLSAQDYLRHKILTLPHQEVIRVYMKLTSLKHVITKNMQKQIELRHSIIQNTFQECLKSKSSYEDINQQALRDSLKKIQRFNQKYELISQRVNEIKNINKILHFSKALEKFRVNTRLLKSMMQDFDHNSTSKINSQLINTLKISKIIKEISTITVKFDFSGIKSYQEERHLVNNTKGAIFGFVQRELINICSKLPSQSPIRRIDLEKQIMNKFIILNNIMKLKDFCIPFYKNTLKQMSELLKKSLVIGQSVDERDPKTYLSTFQEYFTNNLNKKLVQNGIIFINFDQILKKSNIKSPFNFSFFQKYWENVTGFMKDLITWSIQNDNKDILKENNADNIFEATRSLQTKTSMPRYFTAIIWKYPIIYEALTFISNRIHLHIINNCQFQNYEFQTLKQQFLRVLLPLAQLYYKQSRQFYTAWKNKLERLMYQYQQQQIVDNMIQKRMTQLFVEDKNIKGPSVDIALKIVDWMIFKLKTKQIYDFHCEQIISVVHIYVKISKQTIKIVKQNQSKDSYVNYLNKIEDFIKRTKDILNRGLLSSKYQSQGQLFKLISSEGVMGSFYSKIVCLIRLYRQYDKWLLQSQQKLNDIV